MNLDEQIEQVENARRGCEEFEPERGTQIHAAVLASLHELKRLRERMCVTCGRVADVPRDHVFPECCADGYEPCLFDMTQQEAMQHWRQIAHDERARNTRFQTALRELAALVRGECPALLDDDRGGNSALAIEIEELERTA